MVDKLQASTFGPKDVRVQESLFFFLNFLSTREGVSCCHGQGFCQFGHFFEINGFGCEMVSGVSDRSKECASISVHNFARLPWIGLSFLLIGNGQI